MAFFSTRSVEPRAVRLCVLGTGVAMLASGMPWQMWNPPCFVVIAWGEPLLAEGHGMVRTALALAILVGSTIRFAEARQLITVARWRAWLATAAAAVWVAPLPFGPSLPPHASTAIHWSWFYEAGAVGASAAAIGAAWWAVALSRAACDRPFRRALRRVGACALGERGGLVVRPEPSRS